jgi:CDP-glycerol glycerophosphotransferase
MKILDFFFDIFLIILSFIIPKNKKIYLFGANHGKSFIGNPKYLYLYLNLNNHDIYSFWITEDKNIVKELNSKNLPVIYKYSFKGFFKILRSNFLIIEQMPKDIIYLGYFIIGRFNYIQTFHGIAFKKIGNDAGKDGIGIAKSNLFGNSIFEKSATYIKTLFKKNLLYKKYSMILSSSEDISQIIKSAFSNEKIEILGYPRNDIFFNANLSFINYNEILKLTEYSKIVCYVPTFRDNYNTVNPFTEKHLREINVILKKKNILFLVKKHQYDKNIQIPSNLSNIINVSEIVDDIQELLLYTDILITDYSSVCLDFALTKKPIIFYSYDYEKYLNNCRGMYYDYYEVTPGPIADNEKELFNLIFNSDEWFNKPEYQKKFMKSTNQFNYYQDGNSSQRLIDFLKNKK